MQDDSQNDAEIQEGELVASDIKPSESADTSATILESLESMIRGNLVKLQKLSEELKQHREMIDSALGNDEVYKQHAEEAKKASKVKTATKQQILKRPENAALAEKAKEVAAEIKEIKESMNSYLQEYQRLSGTSEIDDPNGVPLQIVSYTKLVRRRP